MSRPVGRRELLGRAAGAVVLGGSLAALLEACGDDSLGPQAEDVARRSIGIDYASYYPPIEDLRRLVRARAREKRALVTFSQDPASAAAQLATVKRFTGPRGGFRVLVIAPFDATAVGRATEDADAKIVSFIAPIPGQDAAVATDPRQAGALLGADAARWANERIGGKAGVLLVRPDPQVVAPDPYRPLAPVAERAMLAQLTRAAPGAKTVAATTATARADAEAAVANALGQTPGIGMVLAWNDAVALGAADALRKNGEGAALYAGGLGAPALTGADSLDELRGGAVLQCLVAPRLRDIANAAVDVPWAILQGRPARDAIVAVRALGPSSPELAAYRSDYVA